LLFVLVAVAVAVNSTSSCNLQYIFYVTSCYCSLSQTPFFSNLIQIKCIMNIHVFCIAVKRHNEWNICTER